ncbi:MAG TPA: hypothetical protein ENN08_04530 [Bacteroidales bacterium]|nr:hypothetical protein [Bacteroidales bacterium]
MKKNQKIILAVVLLIAAGAIVAFNITRESPPKSYNTDAQIRQQVSSANQQQTTTHNQVFTVSEHAGYKSVKIGYQEWMTENLSVTQFRNGDAIPEAKTDHEWKVYNQQKLPAWCYYANNPENGEKYGKLYNWYAVSDPRGLAPEGWRIPVDIEWGELGDALGGAEDAGHKMKSLSGWRDNGNGTNESHLSAQPAGYRHYNGAFHSVGDNGFWWSLDVYDADNAMGSYVSKSLDNLYRNFFAKGYGFSVRCIRE